MLSQEIHSVLKDASDRAAGAGRCDSAVDSPASVDIRAFACDRCVEAAYGAPSEMAQGTWRATHLVSTHSATGLVQPTSSAHVWEQNSAYSHA